MRIDLTDEKLFKAKELLLDKPINFIFGKNGTGKSTISKLIKEQVPGKDIRLYQGIESVITNGNLNAVTLGEDNVEAQKKIQTYESQILDLEKNKEEPYTKKQSLVDQVRSKENKINKFYIDSARKIKEHKLHIASTSYNKVTFEEEVEYAFHLSEDEKEKCKEYLKIDEKIAKKINLPDVDFLELLESTNSILITKVEGEKGIKRLNTDSKINFAKEGLEIHNEGDSCSFCGGLITSETFSELEVFFSASKITDLERSIKKQIGEIQEIKGIIESITIDTNCFYSQFQDEVMKCKNEFDDLKSEQIIFLSTLEKRLQDKSLELFSKSVPEIIEVPDLYDKLVRNYNDIVVKNNAEDFSRLKNFSRELLRFSLIHMYIEKYNLTDEKKDKSLLEAEILKYESECKEIDDSIEEIRNNILEELKKTKSEKKLAININKKLELYVSFQLEHIDTKEDQHQGYYRIKNKAPLDDEYRDIETLSKGERNILGFLYFIEKLNEERNPTIDKVIIFDDPMDSNDDMMQYIMVTEIQEIMKSIDRKKKNDILVLMTHNAHFYINVKYNRLYEDGKDRYGSEKKGDRFIRLQKQNSQTLIETLTSEGEDFTTSYELLWKELRFLYKYNKPNLMLNSIRRIIETYTKFNRINDFYNNNREAQKLFNVNSHSIDDLEAELNGRDRDNIIELMRRCFCENNGKNHFKSHWKASNK